MNIEVFKDGQFLVQVDILVDNSELSPGRNGIFPDNAASIVATKRWRSSGRNPARGK